MSAIRYSGNLRIRLTIVNRGLPGINDEYRCHIRAIDVPGSEHCTVYVRPSDGREPLDDPKSFDSAARAVLSFAAAESWPVEAHASTNETGWHIGRSLATRWSKHV